MHKRFVHSVVLLSSLFSLFSAGCSSVERPVSPACSVAPASQINYPNLRASVDPLLQCGLESTIEQLGLQQAVAEQRLGLAVADITEAQHPRFAAINPDVTMYAASLPKIAILLGLFKKIEAGELEWDEDIEALAKEMIRVSSNSAATELFYLVGPEYIRDLLVSPSYNLYDVQHGGGLWVGKEYGKGPAWLRDPIGNFAHAASPESIAQYYYMLDTERLVSNKWAEVMKATLADSELDHKFIRGYSSCCPNAQLFRKSGSWGDFHADSALVYHAGRRYVITALMHDSAGEQWLQEFPRWIDPLVRGALNVPACDQQFRRQQQPPNGVQLVRASALSGAYAARARSAAAHQATVRLVRQ